MSDKIEEYIDHLPYKTVFPADVAQEVDLSIQDQLEKSGVTEEVIQKTLDKAREFMRPITSKKELDVMQKEALTPLVDLRNLADRICRKGREHSNMVSKSWIMKGKAFAAMLAIVEEPLKAYKAEWKAEQDRIKAEEEAEARHQLQMRYAALEEVGMVRRAATIDASERYVIGELVIPIDDIDTADAPTWDNLLRSATMIADEAKAKLEAEEAARKAAAEKLEAEAKKLKADQDALTAKEDAIKKIILTARTAQLRAAGMGQETINANAGALAVMDDAAFEAWLNTEQWRAKEQAKQQMLKDRIGKLRAVGYVEQAGNMVLMADSAGGSTPIDGLHALPEVSFTALIATGEEYMALKAKAREEALRKEGEERARKQAQEEAAQKIKDEAERLARMDDAERWNSWVTNVKQLAPEMASDAGKKAVQRVLAGLDNMTPALIGELN
jgi:hypothetical protein